LSTTTSGVGPLDGLLVIALEQAVAAPLCTARLRQSGARVIKIEREGGDFARQYDTAAAGESSYFTWTNQGKESLQLNIKQHDDLSLLKKLLQQADVFVQNLAPGAVNKLGLEASTLRQTNPRLITCDISGYGSGEAVRHLKAYDLLVQVESGLVSISGGPGALGRVGISLCDIGAGVTAHAAILESLIKRGITGEGEALSVSLFDVVAEWLTVPFIHAQYGAGAPQRLGLLHPSIAPYGAYRTADNIDTLISIQNEREWARLCIDVFIDPDMTTDPLYRNNAERVANREKLDAKLHQHLSHINAETFRQRLSQADIAFGAVNNINDLLTHPALRRQMFRTSAGELLNFPSHPYKINHNDALRAPRIGEHTDAIKREFS